MALTLVEAAKLTQDLLLRGVVETIVSESQVLAYLPFMDVTGNALTYNQEATLPTAAFMAVGDTWTEDTPTFAQKTRSEEHTSELQSRQYLVCRLLLEKKKNKPGSDDSRA